MTTTKETDAFKGRITREEIADKEADILAYMREKGYEFTPSEISWELKMSYPLAMRLMYELEKKGKLRSRLKGIDRWFQAIPVLEVRNQSR